MKQQDKMAIATKIGSKLPALTDKHKDYMNRHAIEHFIYYTSPKRCWCTHCGARFSLGAIHDKETCPNCGLQSSTKKSSTQKADLSAYSLVMQTRGDWQILRYFFVESFTTAEGYKPKSQYAINYKNSRYHTEVLRMWFNPITKQHFVERLPIVMFPAWRKIPYRLNEELRVVSATSERSEWSKEWMYKETCPYGTIHPYYRKRGVTMKNSTYLCVDEYMRLADKKPWAESLLKMGQIKIANSCLWDNSFIRNYERQVRIAIRHGFDFQNVLLRDYEDYLRDLKELGMDTTNPKYLAPADFIATHQAIHERVQKKREIENERRRREYEIEQAIKQEKVKIGFEFRKKVYAGLIIKGHGLTIEPLLTVEQYKEEGHAMHHCVGGYIASHPNALILSAKMDGKRVETIEVDMVKWVIIQSRAVCNGVSKQHGEIVDLVNGKMAMLKRMAKMAC